MNRYERFLQEKRVASKQVVSVKEEAPPLSASFTESDVEFRYRAYTYNSRGVAVAFPTGV